MSTFQQLPSIVIRTILYYIDDLPVYHSQGQVSLLPFLDIGPRWRIETQSALFSCIQLNQVGNIPLNNMRSPVHYEYSSLSKSKDLMGLVQSVKLNVTDREVIDGNYLLIRENIQDCQLLFPNAHTLSLTIDRDMENDTDFSDYSDSPYDEIIIPDYQYPDDPVSDWSRTNVVKFVRYIKDTIPNLKNVSIQFGSMDFRWRSHLEHVANPLFELYNISGIASLTIRHRSYQWDVQSPLIHLSIAYYEECNNAQEIIFRNSSTLESLDICSRSKYQTCIWEILGAQDCIVYPCLQKLTLRQQGTTRSVDNLGVNANYVPFPNLCQLKTDPAHAVKDDIIFRGNEATLDYIDISINNDVAGVIKGVLTGNPRMRLRKVSLKALLNKHPHAYFKSGDDILNLLKYLPNSLCVLDIKCSEIKINSEIIDTLTNLTQLQVLNLNSSKTKLDDVFALVEKLHWIRRLSIYQCEIGEEYKSISAPDVANIVQSKFDVSKCKLENVKLTQSSYSCYTGDDISRSIAMFEAVLIQLFPQGIKLDYSSLFNKYITKWKFSFKDGESF